MRSLLLAMCFLYSASLFSQTVGLFQNDSLAYDGYTLFSPSTSNQAYLIDNCGELINSWTTNYFPGLDAVILPDGRFARAARWAGDFNGGGVGGRIEIYSWDGELEWGYIYASEEVHQHHDFEVLPNGNVLILAWEDRTEQEAIDAGRNPASIGLNGVWPEHIVEVEPVGINQGNIVWEWHIWDHLVQDYDPDKDNYGVVADHPELLDVNYGSGSSADWLHCNAIDYIEHLDQIIINSRNFDEFWIIDHSTTTTEAAGHTGGIYGQGGDILYRWGNPAAYDRGTQDDQKLFGQHHVHVIEDGSPDFGKIIIFNNGAGRPDGQYSTVEIIDPPVDSDGFYSIDPGEPFGPEMTYWSYGDDGSNQFFSQNISGATQMPNGNVLICEGNKGRLFEVTLFGQTVWEYISPVSQGGPVAQGEAPGQNAAFRTYRYPVDYSGFDGKDLTPMGQIELNPLPSTCVLYPEPVLTAVKGPVELDNVYLVANPVQDVMTISNASNLRLEVELFSLAGNSVFQNHGNSSTLEYNLNNLAQGMYVLRILNQENNSYIIYKLIKT